MSNSSLHSLPLWPVLLGSPWLWSSAGLEQCWASGWVPGSCPGPSCRRPLPVQPRQRHLWHSARCRVMQRERNFSSRQSRLRLSRSKNQHLSLLAEIVCQLVGSTSWLRVLRALALASCRRRSVVNWFAASRRLQVWVSELTAAACAAEWSPGEVETLPCVDGGRTRPFGPVGWKEQIWVLLVTGSPWAAEDPTWNSDLEFLWLCGRSAPRITIAQAVLAASACGIFAVLLADFKEEVLVSFLPMPLSAFDTGESSRCCFEDR